MDYTSIVSIRINIIRDITRYLFTLQSLLYDPRVAVLCDALTRRKATALGHWPNSWLVDLAAEYSFQYLDVLAPLHAASCREQPITKTSTKDAVEGNWQAGPCE